MGEATLGDLADSGVLSLGDGYRTKRAEHGRPGFRILRVADVLERAIRPNGTDFVHADFTPDIGSKLSEPEDVILTTKGTVGRVAIYPHDAEQVVYSPQLCYFRIRQPEVIDARFLACWFKSEDFLEQASHRANNTDMAAYINLRDIRSLRLRLPGIREQRAIAEVLGALDDKIAANERLARSLGELADSHFAKLVQRQKATSTFAAVAEVGGGGTPRTAVEEYWSGSVPWATPTDITALRAPYLGSTARSITEAGLASCASSLYPEGSVLMTSRATIGAFAVASRPVAVNQGFIVVNALHSENQWWLFHEMRSRVDEFKAHANGATFLELPRGKFKQLPVRLPPEEVARHFSEFAGPLHAAARHALDESVGLAVTRDELLPLLLSGKVRVRDAEKIADAGRLPDSDTTLTTLSDSAVRVESESG